MTILRRTVGFLKSPGILVLLLATHPLLANDFYVAANGNDANSGLAPDGQHALKSIQAGVDKLNAGDTLFIREGVYRETVVFKQSGTESHPITIEPYENENVVVSGCEPITGWTKFTNNIWRAPMKWTLGLGRNQVFCNGDVLIEARFPNVPSPGLEMPVSGLSKLWPTFGEFSAPEKPKGTQPVKVVSKLLANEPDDYWKGGIYYGVHFQGWCAQTGIIENSKAGEILVGDRTRSWWFSGRTSEESGRGMIIGHMHALDEPGEWVWQQNELYLIPPSGNEPSGFFEAKKRQLALDLSGQKYIHVRHLGIKAASVRMENAAGCTFDNCDLSYISHFTLLYGTGEVDKGRDTIKSGETGIYISGHDNSFLNCSVRFSAGAGFYIRGFHQTIHNCLIDEIDYASHYLNAITDAVTDFSRYENFLVGGHVITYNTMRNAGRHFFNFYGNGTSKASRDRAPMDYMATLFAHNHLYNGMLETRDAGFITGYYCSGGTLDGLNSQVAYNVMHDSYDLFAIKLKKLGIVYLDEGTCNVDLHDNLLWAAPGSLQRDFWFNTGCVGVRDWNNVFLPNFIRNLGRLTPADFPDSKPFRFGHDFKNPPQVPAWPPVQGVTLHPRSAAFNSGGLKDGDCIPFGPVDFNQHWQSIVMQFSTDAKAMNDSNGNRTAPRHQKKTDPLVLEATVNNGARADVKTQWTFAHSFTNEAWVRFNQVPLGEGYRRFRIVYGHTNDAPRSLELCLDSLAGPNIGSVILPKTDQPRMDWTQIYKEAVAELSPTAHGTHDVFLVFHSPDPRPVGEFQYLRFEQYKGEIPLQTNDFKCEVRLGSKDGEKLGEIFPHPTGGASDFRDFVAALEFTTGTQPLYLVVRSAQPNPTGKINWIRLEKADAIPDLRDN